MADLTDRLAESPTAAEDGDDDAQARTHIAHDLDNSLLVEAAAGTGKTTQLVLRLVAVLQQGKTTIERLVAVTFTRKAAGELALRLRQELDRARSRAQDPREQQRLEDALARLEEAHIGTIHGFCAEILRQRPVEAEIDPAFRELDEEAATRLYHQVFARWIAGRLDEMPAALERAIARLAGERSPDGTSPLDRLREAGRSLIEWRDFKTPWQKQPLDRRALIDRLLHELEAVAALSAAALDPRDYLRRALEPVEVLIARVSRAAELSLVRSEAEYAALEAQLLEVLRALKRNLGWKGRSKLFTREVLRQDALAQRDQLIAQLEDFKRHVDADLAALLHHEFAAATAAYEEQKRRTGQLDFLDLLIKTRDLLRDLPAMRADFQARFTHIFVDEFQDTDPLQAEILLLLAADDPAVSDWRAVRPVPGKLFLVGDPKQSIYRFRRADVLLYQRLKQQLQAAGVALLRLTRSFRAIHPLQQAINAAFAQQMTGDRDSGQPEYVPLAPHRAGSATPQPALVVLPVPTPYGWEGITEWSVAAGQPAVVAAWLDWLFHHSAWTVEDPQQDGARVPIAPRHVALLFRRYLSWQDDVTAPYLRELEARGIPHLLVGSRSFHQREEVETLRAALTAIEWPDDELAVFATLKGSLFAVPDHLLLRFRHEVGPLHPFRPLPDDLTPEFLPLAQALGLLAELHRERNQAPIVMTVLRLLAFTRAHAGFALRPAGQQVLANVQHICDLARSFELRGGLSFRGFVERLSEEAEKPGATQAPVLEEGADGVRIMTVHGAKGLEFPVVILADITANLSRSEPGLAIDAEAGLAASKLLGCAPWELLEKSAVELVRDRAEGVRLAYVAATRARDLLVVSGVGDEPWEDGWASPLNPVLYPSKDRFRTSEPGPGCPAFGEVTVIQRPQRFDGSEFSVRPGMHRPEVGEQPVVWWDPCLLQLEVPGNFGLQREQILSRDADPRTADASVAAQEAWSDARAAAIAAGSVPSLVVQPVTDLETLPPGPPLEIRIEMLPRPPGRPGGPRFGTLVHTVLRDALGGDTAQTAGAAARPDVRSLVEWHGRLLAATPAELAAATASVERALTHSVLEAAARADRQHRETPFVLALEPGHLIEGTVDLAFLAAGTWTVVDFKTDADLTSRAEAYRRQLAWYVFALARLTGQPARGILLGV